MIPKPHRLHKTKEIEKVFRGGRGFFGTYFLVKTAKPMTQISRFTVVVSTKVDKRAVRRNRMKRVLRAILMEHASEFRVADYIFTVKPSAKKLYPDTIRPEFVAFLRNLKFISHEKDSHRDHSPVPKNTVT